MTENVLEAVGITKSFGADTVVNDVTIGVGRGETLCVLGRSGSGKSTLLRCLNMLERPDSGAVFLNGQLLWYRQHGNKLREISSREEAVQRRDIGMVFQQFNLFPHKTVLENITESPRKTLRLEKTEANERARELLARVGLESKARAFPEELSGGQQQRVAIARALAMRPKVMLFDEPTSALDPEMVSEVLDVIRDLVRDGMTTIIVTHEIGFAREVSHRFMFMENGVVLEQGPSSLLTTGAEHQSTRDFLAKVL
jgi:polar amino acid transport system ATP-binding protein